MVNVELTRNADNLICMAYEEYLSRLDAGESARQAADFSTPARRPGSFLSKFSEEDISLISVELGRAGLIRRYVRGFFLLETQGIIYMEKRFPQGVSQVLEWMAKIKSAIPFA